MEEELRKFFKKDRYAGHAGIELLEVSEGRAKARMKIEDYHLNALDIVHGAAIFTLADLVFAVASNSHGNIAMAINASISFLKAVRGGLLYATAEEESRNPKLATYTVRVTNEENDLIAVFKGMVYRKKDSLPIES